MLPAPQTMDQRTVGASGAAVSAIALGCMGLTGTWNAAEYGQAHERRAVDAFRAALECGITFFDHADFYGGFTCETAFAACLAAEPGIRERIYVATKCGILNVGSDHYYNLSPEYIEQALAESLKRLGTDYVDLYQMHRPDPLSHPRDTAAVLDRLVRDGRVRAVGVSNYYPEQVRALREYLEAPLVSNQVAISLMRLEPVYDDGVLDQCAALGMAPLAYSPLGGGRIGRDPAWVRDAGLSALLGALQAVGDAHGASRVQVALAWLLAHPAGIIPLVGSNKPDHIREFAGATSLKLTREEWYRLWIAGRGRDVP